MLTCNRELIETNIAAFNTMSVKCLTSALTQPVLQNDSRGVSRE